MPGPNECTWRTVAPPALGSRRTPASIARSHAAQQHARVTSRTDSRPSLAGCAARRLRRTRRIRPRPACRTRRSRCSPRTSRTSPAARPCRSRTTTARQPVAGDYSADSAGSAARSNCNGLIVSFNGDTRAARRRRRARTSRPSPRSSARSPARRRRTTTTRSASTPTPPPASGDVELRFAEGYHHRRGSRPLPRRRHRRRRARLHRRGAAVLLRDWRSSATLRPTRRRRVALSPEPQNTARRARPRRRHARRDDLVRRVRASSDFESFNLFVHNTNIGTSSYHGLDNLRRRRRHAAARPGVRQRDGDDRARRRISRSRSRTRATSRRRRAGRSLATCPRG